MLPIDNIPIDLKLSGAEVYYWPEFIDKIRAAQYFKELHEHIKWRQDDIKVFGKIYPQPRLTALYATNQHPYSYSNITMYPELFTSALSEIKKMVEHATGERFTTCLLNLYRDGKDSNGWHADNEKELGKNPAIASLSLGAERVFKLRNIADPKNQTKLTLASGSLLLMKGQTQHNWQHQIPKTAKNVGPRINLTFRKID